MSDKTKMHVKAGGGALNPVVHFGNLEVSGFVMVEDRPTWISSGSSDGDGYARLLSVLDFFVLNNPNASLTSRSVAVEEYGWDNPWRKPVYLNRRIKDASNNRYLYYSAGKYDEMEVALEKAGLLEFTERLVDEKACFYDCQNNQSLSFLYHLRNSFCHGRFAFAKNPDGDLWVICEDVAQGKKGHAGKRLSARMVLRLETLENIKLMITSGPTKE